MVYIPEIPKGIGMHLELYDEKETVVTSGFVEDCFDGGGGVAHEMSGVKEISVAWMGMRWPPT